MSSNFDELMAGFKKTYGDAIGGKGVMLPDMERIPTGFFPLDLAIGGGVPRGRITEIYGGEGSGKTNLCLSMIGQHMRLWPDQKCAIVDIEGTFDPDWAKNFGIDKDQMYFLRPDYAEQAVDIVEALLNADDCGLVVVDSLAAMVTIRESEQSAEKSDVGGEAQAVKKMMKKATLALNKSVKAGRAPTLVAINQTRMKIGVMYGNPETTPGGMAKNFMYSMRLRVYGKDEFDAKVSKSLPALKHTTVTVQKHKCQIAAKSAEYDVVMVPHKGMPVGYCNEWSIMKKYMEDYGFLYKLDKGGYQMFDKQYKTLTEARAHVEQDKELADLVKEAIFEKAKEEAAKTDLNVDKGDDGKSIPETDE